MEVDVLELNKYDNKWFEIGHLKENMKARSVKGGVSTMFGQIISFGMTTVQTFILARLLAPDDHGLIAMVSSVTGFVTIFKDFGLASAVIQKDRLTQSEVTSLFWINVLISAFLALVVGAIAPAIVHFYQEDRLLPITLIFALNIFIVGLSLQHNALMKRQMQFNRLAVIQLVTLGVTVAAGILFGWLGYGYWAIVIQSSVYAILETALLWILCDWRPDLSFKTTNVKSYLKFGAGITGFDVVNHFSRNMDNVFVGKYAGAIALGLYSKAYQLLMLPITQLRNPLNSVAIPALSSLQKDEVQFRSFYSRYLFILAFFSMPVVVYLGVFAKDLILIALGEQWVKADVLFQYLAIAAFVQPVISTTGLILITTGRVKKYFRLGVVNAIFMVSGFALGVYLNGVKGVAIAQPIVVYLLFIPTLYYTLDKTPVSVALFFKEISAPFIFSLISGAAMLFYALYLKQHYLELNPIFYCFFGFVVGAITYLLLMVVFPFSRAKFMNVLNIASFLKKG